jgi:hypothetical protein
MKLPHSHLRKIALAIGASASVFLFAVLRGEPKPELARPAQQTPSKDFGRPVSIEMGTELFPLHQGFLQCSVDELQPEFRHGHTSELFDNLDRLPASGDRAVSVGHGGAGLQCTGLGDHCNADDTIVMGNFNPNFWEPLAGKIKGKYRGMTLLGCEIGQGNEGAEFLYQMAQTIQAPVRAPDSLIFCVSDGIYFDTGGKWVEATPKSKPAPHFAKTYEVPETETFRFQIDRNVLSFKPTDVESLEFQHRGYRQKEFQTIPLAASELLRMVGFSAPFETPGRPAAIVTGTFRLRLKLGAKTVDKNLVLYNDVLVEDLEQQDVFYRVNRVRLSGYVARFAK